MSIAVFDILQLSIFNKFSLIAGNRGLNNTVRSVNVLDFEFDLMKDPTHPRCRFDKDGFVVTSFLFAKESPQDIIKTVEWLIEDGVSGLAIRDVYFKTLGQEITDLCDRSPKKALAQASHFDVKILLAGVNPSPPCRPRAGTSRQHCRKVSVKIGFGNMAEPDHSGLP